MARINFLLPIAFALILLPCTTMAFAVRSISNTFSTQGPFQFAQAINPEIEKACANALYKVQCINTLKAVPQSQNANIKDLAFINLNLTQACGQRVNLWIKQELKNPTLVADIKNVLVDCQDQYSDAIEQIDKSIQALKNATPMSFNDAQTFLSAALTNVDTCEEGLVSKKARVLINNGNLVCKELISSSLAIVNVAKNM